MELKLSMIADCANVSQDGKLNVMGMFSRILAPSFPVTHPLMHLVLVFAAGNAERGMSKQIQIRLLDEDGNAVLDVSANLEVPTHPGPSIDLQQILALQMMQFQKPGDYAFHILVNGETKTVMPLVLVQQAAPQNG